MEKKEVFGRHNSIWAIFGSWSISKSFLGRRSDKNDSKLSLGFTLVELLVVIGTLSILIAVILVTINPFAQFQKANDSRRKSDLSQIQKAIEVYYQDNGSYPPSSSGNDAKPYRLKKVTGEVADWGTPWIVSYATYMATVPIDPVKTRNYVYYSIPPLHQSYWLYASLERSSDPQICQNLNANGECSNVPAANLCGTGVKCNYGVSSSNVSP